jgi:hypothetical protein
MKTRSPLFLFYQFFANPIDNNIVLYDNSYRELIILWGDEMAFSPADMPSRLGGGDHRINEV